MLVRTRSILLAIWHVFIFVLTEVQNCSPFPFEVSLQMYVCWWFAMHRLYLCELGLRNVCFCFNRIVCFFLTDDHRLSDGQA